MNNNIKLNEELTALRAEADKRAEQVKEKTTEELNADFNARQLYALINEAGEPIYIIDDYEILNTLNPKNYFYIYNFGNALPARFSAAIQNAQRAVIFLIKKNTKKINDIFNLLNFAGVPVFRQDANAPFKTIKNADISEVKKELAEQYRANYSAGGTIAEFKNVINSNVNTPAIKTGFNILDKVLDGGLYEGLYAIGAISSLGKTTFCLNIAEQIANAGQDVIIFALEMSKASLISRSISRLTFVKQQKNPETINYSWCKTSRGITDGSRYAEYNENEKQLINDAINYYAEHIGKHLFIYEAVGEFTADVIREIVKKHMMFTGSRPVVIIDYLQLIQHPDKFINGNDKIRTDLNLTALKQLSRSFKLPIIAISSFNRGGYSKAVTLESFKESGGIDYTCDVIMGLQLAGVGSDSFDVNEAKAENPRKIELVFLKNRDAAVGDLIKYYYYPMFNHFEESSEDVRAQREYEQEQSKAKKEKEKLNKAEQAKAERAELVKSAFEACEEKGTALITDMVEFCGGKPLYKTFERYIKETGKYKVIGNKVIKA